MTRPDTGTFLTGAFLAAMGAAFVLEAAGAWTFRLTDLRMVGPVALILVGAAVLVSAAGRDERRRQPG